MTVEIKAKNSLRIQLASLSGFAEGLGYRAVDTKNSVVFLDIHDMHKEYKQIGLHSMVLLHNFIQDSIREDGETLWVYVGGKWFSFPLYFANRAIAGKVVADVDLYIDKETKYWTTNKQWVRFVNHTQPLFEDYLGRE